MAPPGPRDRCSLRSVCLRPCIVRRAERHGLEEPLFNLSSLFVVAILAWAILAALAQELAERKYHLPRATDTEGTLGRSGAASIHTAFSRRRQVVTGP